MSLAIKLGRAKVGGAPGVMASRRGLQGDPGIFGDIGGFLSGAGRIAGGFLTGGLAGGISAATGIISGSGTVVGRPVSVAASQPVVSNGTIVSRSGFQAQDQPLFELGPFTLDPFGAGAQGAQIGFNLQESGGGGSTATAAPANGKCQSGFHLNKATYFLKGGQRILKGTVCVKNRRRNSLNERATSNAIKRLEGAKKASKNIRRVTIRCGKCPGKCVCP